jgi:hypothetical protein
MLALRKLKSIAQRSKQFIAFQAVADRDGSGIEVHQVIDKLPFAPDERRPSEFGFIARHQAPSFAGILRVYCLPNKPKFLRFV